MPKYNLKDKSKKYRDKNEKIEKAKKKPKIHSVSFGSLYRYCSCNDKFLLFLAFVTSIIIGVAQPVNMLIYRSIIDILVGSKVPPSYYDAISPLVMYFGIIAIVTFITGFIQFICLNVLNTRIGRQLKHEYFNGLIRQDIQWFDKQQTGKLITSLTDDVESVQTATTDKLTYIFEQTVRFVSSIVIAFVTDWRLTLFGLISLPMMIFVFLIVVRFLRKFAILQIKSYSVAGGIAEEILSGLRTVTVPFNAQKSQVSRYVDNLKIAEKYGIKRAICQGIASGSIGFIIWTCSALLYYMGLKYLAEGSVSGGAIVLVFFNVIIGGISIGNTIPNVDNLIQAKVAGYRIFKVIDQVPTIDYKATGKKLDDFAGDIEFKNVSFNYPTRPDVPVLQNFNFTIREGQTVAFIGPSGSGKSTIIHLLQRFYDPDEGQVLLHNEDMRHLDVSWLRSNIGVVQQQPVLFSETVSENIKMGKLDANSNKIEEAAKRANAFDFINKTQMKFDTELGDRGAGFSGGQKQRIAIACALIREPPLLLLDEATSALDNISEKIVQKTIDNELTNKVSESGKKKTVVMVAHRLQTVRNADVIVVMKNGEIIEQGSHKELVDKKGVYWNMLKTQETNYKEQAQTDDDVESEYDNEIALESKKSSIQLDNLAFKGETLQKTKSKRFQTLKDFGQLMKINKPEAKFIVLGVIMSFFTGAVFPCCSLLFSQLYEIFRYVHTDPARFESDGKLIVSCLLIPAFVLLIGQILKNLCFGYSGEALTTRMRQMMLQSMLNQEMTWFDIPANQPGALTGRLALEASLVKGAAGLQIGTFVEAGVTMLAALIISFIFSWQLTLLFCLVVPLVIVSGIMQGQNMSKQSNGGSYANTGSEGKTSTSLALECLNNIRGVQALGIQTYMSEKFNEYSTDRSKYKYCKIFLYGLFGGIGVCASYIAFTLVFWVGSIMLDQKTVIMINLIRVFICMNLSSSTIGRALANSPDVEKSRQAARKALDTIYKKSQIDPSSTDGIIPPETLKGQIEFKDINFQYPTRPNISVLRSFNLHLEKGETVAIVGHSGCGKSTLFQLLQRFYDPTNSPTGQILIDGYNIKLLNVAWLRSQISIVSQEPILFNVSVAENIMMGENLLQAGADVTKQSGTKDERMVRAAKMANIHDFIVSLPQGYSTKVGHSGSHLSGGQKQRVCIARALYREPAILLLDEATSALDSTSESAVLEAVLRDNSYNQNNKTCLSIAHRLSSLHVNNKEGSSESNENEPTSQIVVMEGGKVAEMGTHTDILKTYPNGIYANMLKANTDV